MRFSKLFAFSLKEAPKDCVLKSHSILVRGAFIKQIGSGIYSFLPLAKIVLDKVQKIIKEEMDKAGANEVRLGFVTPASLWEESNRFDKYGKELLVFNDRKDNRFVLGPTHEESALDCVMGFVKSYKQLPLNIYQIHIKFRDEIRPRFGLMRAREFIMKDAYSFHSNKADLDREFDLMEQTYKNIFERLGVEYRIVDADSGAIGGSGSKEFMLLAESGEDSIAICKNCDYAANIEAAQRKPKKSPESTIAPQAEFARFHTPKIKNIKDLSEFFKTDAFWTMKCVAKKAVFASDSNDFIKNAESAFIANAPFVESNNAKSANSPNSTKNAESSGKFNAKILADFKAQKAAPCFFFLRGCDELNATKALNAIPNALDLLDLSLDELESLGLVGGFIGAYGLENITKSPFIYFDNELKDAKNLICGANERDYHFVGVDLGAFSNLKYADLLEVKSGDLCVKCGGELEITKGIEIGHIFKLGKRYSEPLNATFLDNNGKAQHFEMGCYGIGVSRILPAILEQKADSKGAIWGNVAPFEIVIIISNTKNGDEVSFAEKLYGELLALKCEVLLDDRAERFGVKMADFELMGFQNAIIIGKELQNNAIEIIRRESGERIKIDASIATSEILEQVRAD